MAADDFLFAIRASLLLQQSTKPKHSTKERGELIWLRLAIGGTDVIDLAKLEATANRMYVP